VPGCPSSCCLCLHSLFPILACCLIFLQLYQSPPASVSPSSIHYWAFFRVPTMTSFQHPLHCTVLACTQLAYISLYFCCLFACNKSFLDRLAFWCVAWSRPLGCGREFYLGFWVEDDKCWLEVLSPQCQEIIVTCALVGSI
jgi:hypothetical protein